MRMSVIYENIQQDKGKEKYIPVSPLYPISPEILERIMVLQ